MNGTQQWKFALSGRKNPSLRLKKTESLCAEYREAVEKNLYILLHIPCE
jgi:hypothetical protein